MNSGAPFATGTVAERRDQVAERDPRLVLGPGLVVDVDQLRQRPAVARHRRGGLLLLIPASPTLIKIWACRTCAAGSMSSSMSSKCGNASSARSRQCLVSVARSARIRMVATRLRRRQAELIIYLLADRDELMKGRQGSAERAGCAAQEAVLVEQARGPFPGHQGAR